MTPINALRFNDQIIHSIKKIRRYRIRHMVDTVYFNFRKLTWRSRPLPRFLIIGAQKSGTSSLHAYLNQHPQLFASPYKKEIHFFDVTSHSNKDWLVKDNYSRGESWYRAHFPSYGELPNDGFVFESTPDYLYLPIVPERIHRLLPNVKLIVLMRNPSDRAISHYFMTKRKGNEPLQMMVAFEQEEERLSIPLEIKDYANPSFSEHSYKSRGRYAEQLEQYLAFFPMSQILMLPSEKFFKAPEDTVRQVFNFIGVDDSVSVTPISAKNIGNDKAEIPTDVLEYLDEYFLPYNQKLELLTGIDFGWLK